MKKIILIVISLLLILLSIILIVINNNKIKDIKYKYNDKYLDIQNQNNQYILKDKKRNIELIDGYNKKYNKLELSVRKFNKNEKIDNLLNIFSIVEDIYDFYLKKYNYKIDKINIIVNLDENNSRQILDYIVLGNKKYYENKSVLMHEVTHLITKYIIKEDTFESNILKEAYSDIMSMVYTNSFIIGDSNYIIRNIENPYLNNNPIKINDKYYNNSIHNNSTVISHIAYKSYIDGAYTLEEMGKIWFNSLYLYNQFDFYNCYLSIIKSCNNYGLSEDKIEIIKNNFKESNIKGL